MTCHLCMILCQLIALCYVHVYVTRLYGIVSAKIDLTHVFSRFQFFVVDILEV